MSLENLESYVVELTFNKSADAIKAYEVLDTAIKHPSRPACKVYGKENKVNGKQLIANSLRNVPLLLTDGSKLQSDIAKGFCEDSHITAVQMHDDYEDTIILTYKGTEDDMDVWDVVGCSEKLDDWAVCLESDYWEEDEDDEDEDDYDDEDYF